MLAIGCEKTLYAVVLELRVAGRERRSTVLCRERRREDRKQHEYEYASSESGHAAHGIECASFRASDRASDPYRSRVVRHALC